MNSGYQIRSENVLINQWNVRMEYLPTNFNDYSFTALKDFGLDTHHSIIIYDIYKLIYDPTGNIS